MKFRYLEQNFPFSPIFNWKSARFGRTTKRLGKTRVHQQMIEILKMVFAWMCVCVCVCVCGGVNPFKNSLERYNLVVIEVFFAIWLYMITFVWPLTLTCVKLFISLGQRFFLPKFDDYRSAYTKYYNMVWRSSALFNISALNDECIHLFAQNCVVYCKSGHSIYFFFVRQTKEKHGIHYSIVFFVILFIASLEKYNSTYP